MYLMQKFREYNDNTFHVTVKNVCMNYSVTWYELWDSDDGDYYGLGSIVLIFIKNKGIKSDDGLLLFYCLMIIVLLKSYPKTDPKNYPHSE